MKQEYLSNKRRILVAIVMTGVIGAVGFTFALPQMRADSRQSAGSEAFDAGRANEEKAGGQSVLKSTAPRADDAVYYWPQWRGPLGTGVAPHGNPPVEWSEDENIRWKISLPGDGLSTPIIWGGRLFLTSAIPVEEATAREAGHRPGEHDNVTKVHRQKFVVLAINRDNGEIIWRKTVREDSPHEGHHITASYASASPVTDGERVYAFFGSNGLYCLDMEGNVKWEKDLGNMHTKHGHGEGASPALYRDILVVNWDHEGQSFVVAFDKTSGDRLWKRQRDEPSSWSTPIVVEGDDRPQVVISAPNRIRGYDLGTGEVIWKCGGLSGNVVASPVSSDGMVYAGSSYRRKAMVAIDLKGARGDITGTDRVAWTRDRHTPYVPSPVLYEGNLYYLRHLRGTLTSVKARSGETRYGPVRLPDISRVFASPVAAAGRVYITSRRGATLVLDHGSDEPEALALNRLNDTFTASAAVVDSELFLRGEEHLYCITENRP